MDSFCSPLDCDKVTGSRSVSEDLLQRANKVKVYLVPAHLHALGGGASSSQNMICLKDLYDVCLFLLCGFPNILDG